MIQRNEQLFLFPDQDVRFRRGVDSFALLETPFPISRPPKTVDSLTWSLGEGRQVTLLPSAKYGFPASLEQEILAALVQLTMDTGFSSRTLTFRLNQVTDMLGKSGGVSVDAIVDGFRTLRYSNYELQKSWYDAKIGDYVDITDFTVFESIRVRRRKDCPDKQQGLPCTITWHQAIFDSLRQGDIKPMDMEFFRRLPSGVPRKLYRVLDTYFQGEQTACEISLDTFFYLLLGYSQTQPIKVHKHKAEKHIRTLEREKYINRCDDYNQRYVFNGRTPVAIRFQEHPDQTGKRQNAETTIPLTTEQHALIKLLRTRKITKPAAEELVSTCDAQVIRDQISYFDFLAQSGHEKAPGFLRISIVDNYSPPKGMKPPQKQREEDERKGLVAAINKFEGRTFEANGSEFEVGSPLGFIRNLTKHSSIHISTIPTDKLPRILQALQTATMDGIL